jgi:DNA-binding transcriptional LysR family regulator
MDLNEVVVFTRVVETGSFTAAARSLDMPKSTVSRKVSALESRLGAQLLHRTTRKLSLTDVGAAYHERCARIISQLEDADHAVAEMQSEPRGVLRVTAPLEFGFLSPIISDYLLANPHVSVDLVCTDRVVDLVAEGYDVAIRAGKLADSALIATRLGTIRRLLLASPEYVERRGSPTTPDDLRDHECLRFSQGRERTQWVLHRKNKERRMQVSGRLLANSFETLQDAVLRGMGIGMLPEYWGHPYLAEGRLVRVLDDWCSSEDAISAVYPGTRHLSPKVRVFLDTLRAGVADAPWASPSSHAG